ncbi:hydroxymethylglutaryl-CoA reductase [Alteromonas sp. ASW11-36]|uniref:hydroxymethylglutaryl-CoA reductase (NADPH) n=1 Tax=Alteromonas arenosi TaxID=3055817 RepID=A0ABT7SW88_9ALTE|nr:hydroxymethylglutaryl-CoA reductase [Alteromonas sp. ASW11-36]MDM7859832.1 hydroxymethylglutaryl-CoA reductase [Alteromonas sp. ASW11-36]
MFIPSSILRKLYTKGSLRKINNRVFFEFKNRLKVASLEKVLNINFNGQSLALGEISIKHKLEELLVEFNANKQATTLPLGGSIVFSIPMDLVSFEEQNKIQVTLQLAPFGEVSIDFSDVLRDQHDHISGIPRDGYNNLSESIIQRRQEFVREQCQTQAPVLFGYRGDTAPFEGNIENFIGTAQVPVGLAGPLLVKGAHADGEFYVPLATTEGTLVASYSRGMKLINGCGGVKVTVMDSAMQRAPVFVFNDAAEAKTFLEWLMAPEQQAMIKNHAENTDPFVKFKHIDPYTANKFVFVRFNFATGDAAGQNMVGQATYAACNWIISAYPKIENFYLESNMATDKKASQINTMHTRGKRVTAEVTLKKSVLQEVMHVDPEQIDYHARVASIGSFLAGVNNNGLHAANGIAALFIATGQDAANVAESSTGILYSEITPDGDLYLSLTLPSLIVATYGGGTGLPTQQECLKMMGCTGENSAMKFAEIVAGTALAGEISLASAISSLDWVSSHEQYGRNR